MNPITELGKEGKSKGGHPKSIFEEDEEDEVGEKEDEVKPK